MRSLIAAIVLLAASGAGSETLNCNHIASDDDLSSLSVGRVAAGGRVYFVLNALDRKGCPSAAPECRSATFLLPGDSVVFNRGVTNGGLICVAAIDRWGRETNGWLPAARVPPAASAPNWIGRWRRNTSAEIDITPKSGGKAEVSGSATWGSGAATHDGGISVNRHGARDASLRLGRRWANPVRKGWNVRLRRASEATRPLPVCQGQSVLRRG